MGGCRHPPLRVQCKSPGECVIRCHSHRSRFTPVLAWQRLSLLSVVPIQAARSSMRKGDLRVLAAMPDSGAHRHAEAERTPRPKRLFSPHSFLARQKRMGRRRHSCGITAFYRMSVADNPFVKTCGFATSPCTGEALGGQSRPPLNQSASPVRLHVVHPVIFAFTNCPISRSPPVMRTRRPPSVRAVSRSPSFPSTSTRIVLPTYA